MQLTLVMELEADEDGTVVRAVFYEDSPWPAVDLVGRPILEAFKPGTDLATLNGSGTLADGTVCLYRTTELGGFHKVSIRAGVPTSGPLNVLGNFATLDRTVQIIDQLPNLTFGFGMAVHQPCGVIADDGGLDALSAKLALTILEEMRDPMTLVSRLGDAVAFALPASRLSALEQHVRQIQERSRAEAGGIDKWQFEVVCASPPSFAYKVFEVLYHQASVALGRAQHLPRAA